MKDILIGLLLIGLLLIGGCDAGLTEPPKYKIGDLCLHTRVVNSKFKDAPAPYKVLVISNGEPVIRSGGTYSYNVVSRSGRQEFALEENLKLIRVLNWQLQDMEIRTHKQLRSDIIRHWQEQTE